MGGDRRLVISVDHIFTRFGVSAVEDGLRGVVFVVHFDILPVDLAVRLLNLL